MLRKESSKFQLEENDQSTFICSDVEDFCRRYRVEMKSPENIKSFLDEITAIR
jgi:hypothetical protein